MPAAVAKGIILSISIIAALGLAVVENPQVQQWLEEQRRKIAELLRQIGEELDPQSRRAAEAFAYEGRTVANDDSLRREATGSKEAAEVATGRSLSNASTIRRIPVQGPRDPDEAEERKRKGREYLARRNQQMLELQKKRNAEAKAEGAETPSTPTFDELVDAEGNLKTPVAAATELPSPPAMDPLPSPIQAEMREVERQLSQPILLGESASTSSSGWQMGSAFANPFGDEYELERSMTPRPPVPPKINLSRPSTPPISVPGAFDTTETQTEQQAVNNEELTYEEQLAIALSLSEQESSNAATVRQRQPEEHDDELKAAIAASLKDMDHQEAAHAIAHTQSVAREVVQPLVDLTPAEPTAVRPTRGEWATFFDPQFAPARESLALSAASLAPSEASDELYRLTPELTRARLATFNAQQMPDQAVQSPSSAGSNLPFDPVREAARPPKPVLDVMDASFHSAVDIASQRRRSLTLDHETPHLIDVEDSALPAGAQTPTSRAHSSFGFQTDSDTDTFASLSAAPSRAQSRPRSEISNVEVVDLVEDSDIDMLSEEGDGVATPDSWSEVGSRDADSEMEDDYPQQQQPSRVSL